MKLNVNRFRTRRGRGTPTTDTDLRKTGEYAVPGSGAASMSDAGIGDTEDGFGEQPFETAQGAVGAKAAAEAKPTDSAVAAEIEAIRREGLSQRQLRVARRLAHRHGLPAAHEYDAVRLLRQAGIEPFQRSPMLVLVRPEDEEGAEVGSQAPAQAQAPAPPAAASGKAAIVPVAPPRLPQSARQPANALPSTEVKAESSHFNELLEIQRNLARRRRRNSLLMLARLSVFVFLPTLLAGIYFYQIATPLYATKAEFKIDMPASPMLPASGASALGSSFATTPDSIAVQGYLQSRDALQRLDREMGYIAHFSDPKIDEIQRLPADATFEDAYALYSKNVRISYDPTEFLIKLEVMATDPQSAADFSNALIHYAEEQVDHLSLRVREGQMAGAKKVFDDAQAAMMAEQQHMVELQEKLKIISSESEVQLITGQISQLENQKTAEILSLEQMRSNPEPNQARMEPIVRRVETLDKQIAELRAKLTESTANGLSLAQMQSELLLAQANVETRRMLLSQAVSAMENARVEANRQVRYLSVAVQPVVPDAPAYPKAFENTAVAFLIFAGIYLIIAMTAEVLREQISA